jgi:glyoxylase-like metal-dependent hydrolase (beta-lactamase superfamily II)
MHKPNVKGLTSTVKGGPMKIAENIYFYEGDYIKKSKFPYSGIGSSNFMLITGDDVVLIDSGMTRGPHRKRQARQMKQDGTEASNASHVLFSHVHPDHVMHAKNLCKKKNLNFMFHKDNEQFSRRDEYLFLSHYNYPDYILEEIHGLPMWFVKAAMKRFFGFDYIKMSGTFEDGQVLKFNCNIEIVHLPSHFPGHVGFYFPKEKILYSADLFDFRVAEGGIINSALSSYELVFSDIAKIREYKIKTLIPGHGTIIQGEKNISEALNRVEQGTKSYAIKILKVLKENHSKGISLSDMLPRIFERSIAYNESARKIILYNTLMHLRNRGEVGYVIHNKRASWYLQ